MCGFAGFAGKKGKEKNEREKEKGGGPNKIKGDTIKRRKSGW